MEPKHVDKRPKSNKHSHLSEKQRGKLPERYPPADSKRPCNNKKRPYPDTTDGRDDDDTCIPDDGRDRHPLAVTYRDRTKRRYSHFAHVRGTSGGIPVFNDGTHQPDLVVSEPLSAGHQAYEDMELRGFGNMPATFNRWMAFAATKEAHERDVRVGAPVRPLYCDSMVGNSALTRFGTCDAHDHYAMTHVCREEMEENKEWLEKNRALREALLAEEEAARGPSNAR
ncbi:hypothetical protein ACHAQH_005415 [Verticillium albo-atrum]